MLNIQRNIRKLINHRGHKPLIDHLPENDLPSTVSLATSWNMPKNTTQLGSSGWRRFVFEGTTPDPATTPLPAQSRIEIAVSGATGIQAITDTNLTRFEIIHDNKILTTQIICENDLSVNNFIMTQFRVADISENIPDISDQQEDRSSISGGLVWTRTYNDHSKDLVVYNPLRNIHTVEGITSNAKVWLLHADVSGNWTTGNLYGTNVEPSFTGYSPTPTVNTLGVSGSGVQYEIIF